MKNYIDQISECSKEGFLNENLSINGPEFIKNYPELLPFSPTNYEKVVAALEKGQTWDMKKCGRFGGICHSGKDECRELRGLTKLSGPSIISKIEKDYKL